MLNCKLGTFLECWCNAGWQHDSSFLMPSVCPQILAADAHNLLRPETVESLYILHQVTKDEMYREWAWVIFRAFEKHARVATGGYASLSTVLSVSCNTSCLSLSPPPCISPLSARLLCTHLPHNPPCEPIPRGMQRESHGLLPWPSPLRPSGSGTEERQDGELLARRDPQVPLPHL